MTKQPLKEVTFLQIVRDTPSCVHAGALEAASAALQK